MATKKRAPVRNGTAAPKVKAEAKANGLTARQAAFVREYLVDLNGTQAAIRAGYAAGSAHVQAHGLLRDHKIAAAIDRAMSENPGVTRARIVEELAKIAFGTMGDFMRVGDDGLGYLDLSEIGDAQKAIISELTVDEYTEGRGEEAREVKKTRIKLSDKQAALDKLTRILGGYRDKVALTDPDGGPLQINIVKGLAG